MKKMSQLMMLLIGTFFCAAAFGLFILPSNFVAGGITGLAELLMNVIPLSLSTVVLGLNILVLMMGFAFVGFDFTIKTVGVSFLFPIFLDMVSTWNLFESINPLLSTLISSLLLGVGTAIVIKSGASSGGFDTVALALNKKYNLPMAKMMKGMNVLVIVLQGFSKPFMSVIYGVAIIVISTYVMNLLLSIHLHKVYIHVRNRQFHTA